MLAAFFGWNSITPSPPPTLREFPTAEKLRSKADITNSGHPKLTAEAVEILNKLGPVLDKKAGDGAIGYSCIHHTDDLGVGHRVAAYMQANGYKVEVSEGAIDGGGRYDPYLRFKINWEHPTKPDEGSDASARAAAPSQ